MFRRWGFVAAILVNCLAVSYAQGFIEFDDSNRCTTPKRAPGVCLNIKECPPLLELLRTQRQQPGAADYLRQSVCGYSGFDPLVCCPRDTPVPLVTPATTASPVITERPNLSYKSGLPEIPECGFSNATHLKVVGGTPAALNAWPWMVALGYRPSTRSSSKAPRFLCGASLITNRHVLTAAHCVYNRADLYFARLGELDLQSDSEGANPVDIPIKEKKIHEDYSSSQFTNDIAILTLERSAPNTLSIHPICLPTPASLRSRDFLNTYPFIAGWGAQNFSGPSSSKLLELQIPIVNLSDCKKAFERFKSAVIDERVLCAGFKSGGKDACQGDSGGPLMWPDPAHQYTRYYQIGVVSYGYRCAEPGIPGVYTRITNFLGWISDNVK